MGMKRPTRFLFLEDTDKDIVGLPNFMHGTCYRLSLLTRCTDNVGEAKYGTKVSFSHPADSSGPTSDEISSGLG